MDEVLIIFLVLGLLACTLVGAITILIWLARLLGGGSPKRPTASEKPIAITPLLCNACGNPLNKRDSFCISCGARRGIPLGSAEADLVATLRALTRLHEQGEIDDSSFQHLSELIAQEQTRLRGLTAAPPQVSASELQPVFTPAPAPPHEIPQPVSSFEPAPAVPAPPPFKAEPRRSFAEMLATFMEESSIRWGELVGGLLIIGCSLALVVSLWSEIAERPVLKFSVFMTLTAALFGLGFYSAHRWKLPTTSRGVLLTSTLLVPLNFLAVTALGRSSSGPLIILAELAAWLLFAWFVWLGARVYAPEHARAVTLGTMGSAAALLLAKHAATSEMHWRNWFILGVVPVGCLAASVALALRHVRQRKDAYEVTPYQLFALLGVGTFAACLPLGLLFARGGMTGQAWDELVPLMAALGIPFMAVGWFLWRRLFKTTLANERTIAASLGLSGGALLAGSTVLAFPFFNSMLIVALLNAAVFGWAAWRYGARVVRWMAGVQAVYGLLLIAQWMLGHLALGVRNASVVMNALSSTASGVLLIALFAGFAIAAEFLRTRQQDARTLRADCDWAAALCALLGLWFVTLHGFGRAGDPQHIVWLYGLMTLAVGVLAWRRTQRRLVWPMWFLCWLTSVQACVFTMPIIIRWMDVWAIAFTVVATLAAGSALAGLMSARAQKLFGLTGLLVSGAGAILLALETGLLAQKLSVWYCLPLVWVAAAWALYAWRTERALAAVGGGLLFNLAASVAVFSWFVAEPFITPGEGWARWWQANLAVTAAYTLVWAGMSRQRQGSWLYWIRRQRRFVAGVALAGWTLNAFLITVAPTRPSAWLHASGDQWGWAVGALLAGAYFFSSQQALSVRRVYQPLLVALALGVQLATTWHRWQSDSWTPYYVLLWAVAVTVWLALALLWNASRTKTQTIPAVVWVNALSSAAVFLALRTLVSPDKPWRSITVIASIAVVTFGLHMLRRARGYSYATGALGCLALSLWIAGYATGNGTVMDVLLLNGALLAGLGLASLLVELRAMRRGSLGIRHRLPAFHQFVAVTLLGFLSLWLAQKLLFDLDGSFYRHHLVAAGRYILLIFAILAALLAGSIYDNRSRWRFAVLYWFGLLCAAAWLDQADYSHAKLLCAIAIIVAVYALSAALLWRGREVLLSGLNSLRVPALANGADIALWWLRPANGCLATVGVLLALWLNAGHAPPGQRLIVAGISWMAPFAVGLLLGQSARNGWRVAALALAFGALLAGGWLPTRGDGLAQLVVFTALALGLSGAFFVGEAWPVPQWSSWLARIAAWADSLRRTVRGLGLTGLAALLAVLGLEWLQVNDLGQVELAGWAEVLVTFLFVAVIVSLLGFALWRGRDPLRWEDTRRSRYVYAAEITAVLLFAHARLVAPWLFGGRFQAYWPVIILLLAFIGVMLGEQLRKRGRTVLADPLARTGVFLPLLPSLAFGLVKSNVDYAGVLLGVALFYGMLSVMRQSFGFGLLAVLAANGGWWHWLQRTGDFGFYAHPQVWLIPAALSLLAAAHINRQQLSLEQLTTLRYVSLMTIYISSTADIFLNGVADSPWLPMVLAALSIAGVLLGIMLRVRAYLFLGTAFLLLSVITMVWHAAVSFGWRWLWYVAGIAFGVMIIYLFAMFERHRAAWLLWMERFKTWQA